MNKQLEPERMLDANLWFARSASYPIRSGNVLKPLIDGQPAFSRICEAIENAQHSVWVTIAFISPGFLMPDGHGSLFDVLDKARDRGLDVRVLFWRNNIDSGFNDEHLFSGNVAQRKMLKVRGSRFLVRWDRAHGNYCQHQKSWIVDAGRDGEVGFVGGINLNPESVVSPGHEENGGPQTHDIYAELAGPCATDVHHNFVQRWNEASDRDEADGTWPNRLSSDDLSFPTQVSPRKGPATAQIQRTVRKERYKDGTASPGGPEYDVWSGEKSCFEQYKTAISQAQNYIYLENQALGQPEIVELLHEALERGVVVTVLVPADVEFFMAKARKDPKSKTFFDRLGALGRHSEFTLAGIASSSPSGKRRNIYVHAKAAIIDDDWATIGSCNIGARSFFGDTELNVSFVCTETTRQFRRELFREHLGIDTGELSGVEASNQFQIIARENKNKIENGVNPDQLAFAINPETYGII